MDTAQWTRAAAALDFAALFVLETRYTEWLIRASLLGIALLAFFYSSKPLVKWIISLSVLGLSFFVHFYLLGEGSLHDRDEAIYAQVAKEIAVSDNWLTLTWAGHPFWHKPPLYFWLTAVVYKMVGDQRICCTYVVPQLLVLAWWH